MWSEKPHICFDTKTTPSLIFFWLEYCIPPSVETYTCKANTCRPHVHNVLGDISLLVGHWLCSTHAPLYCRSPVGQKQPRLQILGQGRGKGYSQVRGQAVPQELKVIPLGQAGCVGWIVVTPAVAVVVVATKKKEIRIIHPPPNMIQSCFFFLVTLNLCSYTSFIIDVQKIYSHTERDTFIPFLK